MRDAQTVFSYERLNGTAVGFWLPSFVSGLNVPGDHFHILDEDRKYGGHLMDFTMNSGTLYMIPLNQFLLILPHNGCGCEGADTIIDRTDELNAVEKGDLSHE